jgi:hypothetical protein
VWTRRKQASCAIVVPISHRVKISFYVTMTKPGPCLVLLKTLVRSADMYIISEKILLAFGVAAIFYLVRIII